MVYVQGKTKIYASLIFDSLLHFVAIYNRIYNMKKEWKRREKKGLLWLHLDCIELSVLIYNGFYILIKRVRKWNKALI